jgi:RsiW-degrading membrane proteinase PrsW (M82 family)
VDELDWFDNVASAGKSLKTFYDKTGVQPYVVLLAYDSSLNSDAAKNNYANKYFNENIANEDAFLMIYFAEEDQDEDVGYMSYVCGNNALAVMDTEAVQIFWNNIDEYWYSDLSTDDMFEKVFTNTANTIMGKSSSSSKKSGIVWKILLVVVVIIVALAIAKYFKKKEGTTTSEKKKEDMPNMLN